MDLLAEGKRAVVCALDNGHHFIRWAFQLFETLLRMTPGTVVAATLGFILSQTLLLVALLLPWKLLIFLSSGQFPTTLPGALASFAARELVLVLSATALLAFIVHIVLDTAFGALARRGAAHVLEQHRKTGLFNNQQRVALGFYRHLLRVLVSIASCSLVMLILAMVYPLMLVGLTVCFLTGLVGIVVWRRMPADPEGGPTPVTLNKLWMGGGFLCLTGWIVAGYWRGHLPHLTVAFICLILARQALTFAAQIVQSLKVLGKERSRVDALFLADTPWMPQARQLDDFQELLTSGCRKSWIRGLLAHCGAVDFQILDVHIRTAERGKLAYLTITGIGDVETVFLIKIFHRSLDGLLQQERDVLTVATPEWPAPALVGCHRMEGHQGHHCMVFSWGRDGRWLDQSQRSRQLSELRALLLDCSLPVELIDRYDRSHPDLARRLSNVDWSRMRAVAVSEETIACCASIEAHWNDLLEQVGALPRQVVLPGLVGRMMASRPADLPPVICNWSRWRWEPVGAGWPITPKGRMELRSIFDDYQGPRAELALVDSEGAYRAALLYEMERCLSKSDLSSALVAVERLHQSIGNRDRPDENTSTTAMNALHKVQEKLAC